VEKFLDTPVKRYSSGMYVRLAFAVAAHLNPEILIVDEVLAVGDTQFQKKCIGKMQDVAQGGRTVLFVSHQLATLQKFCTRAILLEKGTLIKEDTVQKIIDLYISKKEFINSKELLNAPRRGGNGLIKVSKLEIINNKKEIVHTLYSGETFAVRIYYHSDHPEKVIDASVGLSIHTASGETVVIMFSEYVDTLFNKITHNGCFECFISGLDLVPGSYSIGIRIMGPKEDYDFPEGKMAYFDIEFGNYYNKPVTLPYGLGIVLINGKWSHQ
jgi:lipopolysaccharide transport system ATP-binding protein